jgi:hypothetical protein
MAPNKDLELYDALNGYYDIADTLDNEVNNDSEISIKQKGGVLYPIIDEIRDLADKMIESYIIYLKDKKDLEKLYTVQNNIDIVLEKIDFFKNKIYEVYRINSKKRNA